jgi:Zn-dependent protease
MTPHLGELGISYLVFLFSTTLHEYGHARIGHALGSQFAAAEGLVTLDPIPHIRRSPFGMVVLPILSVAYFGWAWPMGWASVPYDPHWAARNPRAQALMSLAGPASNLFLAVFAFFVLKLLILKGALVPGDEQLFVPANGETRSVMGAFAFGLPLMLFMNISLGIFNLLPIPPLDGSGEGFFPRQVGRLYEQMRQTPAIPWILFLVAFNFAWRLISPVLNLAADALF